MAGDVFNEVREMLQAWDSGRPIHTIEMGGLGPGYEQALQICMVELCRAMIEEPHQLETKEQCLDRLKKVVNVVVAKIDHDLGGLTGAQVGAATSLAYLFLANGPKETFNSFKDGKEKDRCSLVSKWWPSYR